MKNYLIFGDLAGYLDQLKEIISKVKKDTIIILLGDIPDRGPKTRQLIDYIIDHPEIIWIMGNHEHMMVQCYDHVVNGKPLNSLYSLHYWIYLNGGDATLRSYGIDVKYPDIEDLEQRRKFIKKSYAHEIKHYDFMKDTMSQMHKVDKKHIEKMRSLPLIYETEQFVCTHAPVINWHDKDLSDFKNVIDKEDEDHFLWNRELPYLKDQLHPKGKIMFYGHLNVESLLIQTDSHPGGSFVLDNEIKEPIKGACLDLSQSGNITALEFPSMKIYQEKVK